MTPRRFLRLFVHATLVAVRDSILDTCAALVPTLNLAIESLLDSAREDEERERLVAIMQMTRPAQKETKVWN